MFGARPTWLAHARLARQRGNQRLASTTAWAEGEDFNVADLDFLVTRFVFPSVLYGCEFLRGAALAELDASLRAWGRRLLRWPPGAPNVAVLASLAWWDAGTRVRSRAASLAARLLALSPRVPSVVTTVAAYARSQPTSWLSATLSQLSALGVPAPADWGVGPGAPPTVTRQWCRMAVQRALATNWQRTYRREIESRASLCLFAACVPRPVLERRVHNCRVHAATAREWTLARCGHHPFADGRAHRNVPGCHGVCACGGALDTFAHALRACPLHSEARALWLTRAALAIEQVAALCDFDLLRLLFDVTAAPTAARVRAHIASVASVCSLRRGLDGDRGRRAPAPLH